MVTQCIFIGDSTVGKTSIIRAALSNIEGPQFHQAKRISVPTIGVDVKHHVTDDGEVLNIWDTSGDPKFHSLVRMFEKSCNTIVYVFAANEEASFQSILRWHAELYNNSKKYICVCNKTDLTSGIDFKHRITHLYPEMIFVESSNVVTDNGKRILESILANSNETYKENLQAPSLSSSCCTVS